MLTEILNEESVRLLITVGAGGISFLILGWAFIYLIMKINPTLKSLQDTLSKLDTNTTEYQSLIDNNTSAIRELARSNDNVAIALNYIGENSKALTTIVNEHDKRSIEILQSISEVSVRTDMCGLRQRGT